MDQVAVGAVDLDGLEAGVERAAGGVGELPYDVGDLIDGQFFGRGVLGGEGQGAGADRRPAVLLVGGEGAPALDPGPLGGGLAPGVAELDHRDGALRLQEGGDPPEGLGLGVVPEPEVVRADAPLGADGGGLRDDQPGAARGPRRQVGEVPVRRDSGGLAGRRRAVLAHRGHPDPVGGGELPQGVGGEESGAHVGLPVGSAAGRRRQGGGRTRN